ncbi:hypothetical protein PsYK624_082560 [Phanerochaete sordida]|uniref:Uncharacterized protein n=1 Tax=Phanerochaete sordida TaxID=48140 RepID=A0A9P3G9Y5_9APHY|nr:hypothetical protein PsYK624_082560 [Phanerochaete sordida]
MSSIRALSALLFASAAIAGTVPLAARQSNGICGSLPQVPISGLAAIEVWADKTMLGYLSTDVFENGPPTAYGWITYNFNDALNNVFFCGQPGSGTVVMGADNARTVPGTDSNAIGLVANQWSSTMGSGNANSAVFAPTYASPAGMEPNSTSVGSFDGSFFEGSVWTVQSGSDSAGKSHQYLIPTWVNPDGSTAQLDIAVLPVQGAIEATGDFNTFYSENNYLGNWVQVKFAAAASI